MTSGASLRGQIRELKRQISGHAEAADHQEDCQRCTILKKEMVQIQRQLAQRTCPPNMRVVYVGRGAFSYKCLFDSQVFGAIKLARRHARDAHTDTKPRSSSTLAIMVAVRLGRRTSVDERRGLLREVRELAGPSTTQKDLARMLGVSESWVERHQDAVPYPDDPFARFFAFKLARMSPVDKREKQQWIDSATRALKWAGQQPTPRRVGELLGLSPAWVVKMRGHSRERTKQKTPSTETETPSQGATADNSPKKLRHPNGWLRVRNVLLDDASGPVNPAEQVPASQ